MKSEGAREVVRPDCAGRRFAIVAARFYDDLADNLIDGARRALRDCRVSDDDISLYEVPGCFELPLACRNLIEIDRFEALVALGIIIRGETPHFDFIAGECARGIMSVALASGIPIGFGVLTTENIIQAQERADPQRGDKGYAAGIAAASLLMLTAGEPRMGFRG